jgi:hypothetical protein
MIGASIYGFVDYKNTSRKQEFTKLYESQEETLPVITEEKKVSEEITDGNKKKEEVKKQVAKKEFTPAKSKSNDFVIPVEPIEVKTDATVNTDELKENKAVKKIRTAKSKKLNSKLFSRGSLEERYVEKTLKLEIPKEKSVTKKAEDKE